MGEEEKKWSKVQFSPSRRASPYGEEAKQFIDNFASSGRVRASTAAFQRVSAIHIHIHSYIPKSCTKITRGEGATDVLAQFAMAAGLTASADCQLPMPRRDKLNTNKCSLGCGSVQMQLPLSFERVNSAYYVICIMNIRRRYLN